MPQKPLPRIRLGDLPVLDEPTPVATEEERPPIWSPMGLRVVSSLLAGYPAGWAPVLAATGYGLPAAAASSTAAALIGGAGEIGAEYLEGSDISPSRIGLESLLAAVPGQWISKTGRVLPSFVRGSAVSGVGETGREIASGEGIDLERIFGVSLAGGTLSGALAKFLPRTPRVAAPPSPKVKQPKLTIEEQITKRGWDLPQLINKTAKMEAQGHTTVAHDVRVAGLRIIPANPQEVARQIAAVRDPVQAQKLREAAMEAIAGPERLFKEAKKGIEAQEAAKRISDELKELGLEPGKPKAVQTQTSVDPITGKRTTITTPLRSPEGEEPSFGTGFARIGPPPQDNPLKIIYDEWVEMGLSSKLAMEMAAHGVRPDPAELARMRAGSAVVPPIPPGAAIPVVSRAVSAAEGVDPAAVVRVPPTLDLPVQVPVVQDIPSPVTAALSADLSGAKPRFNMGPAVYRPAFESDIDKAAYILAQTKKSPRDADYLAFVMKHTGLDEAGARKLGVDIRQSLKPIARAAKPGTQKEPTVFIVPRSWRPAPTVDPSVANGLPGAAARAASIVPEQPPTSIIDSVLSPTTPEAALPGQIPEPGVPAGTSTIATAPLGTVEPAIDPIRTQLEKSLRGQGFSAEQIAAMTPEELAKQIKTRTRVPPPKVASRINPDEVLSPEEASSFRESFLRRKLTEANVPPQFIDDYIAGVQDYITKKASADPEIRAAAGTVGARISRELPAILEGRGIVPKGFFKQLGTDLRNDLAAAAEDKLAKTASSNLAGSLTELESVALQRIAVAENPALDAATRATQLDNLNHEYNRLQGEVTKTTEQMADVMPKDEGGEIIGDIFGSFQRIIEKNPLLGLRLGFGGLGALGGALANEEDPLTGAIVGAGVGMSAPEIGRLLVKLRIKKADVPGFDEAVKSPEAGERVGSFLWHLAPHVQRSNFLLSSGLPANAIVGPWALGYFGALTKHLAGDPRGTKALQLLMSTRPWQEMSKNETVREATRLVRRVSEDDPQQRAELGGAVLNQLHPTLRKILQQPAFWLTQGDVGIRNIIREAGFSEKEARQITATSEPFLRALKKLVQTRKGPISPTWELIFPFVRTPAALMEMAATRFPGLGYYAQKAIEKGGGIPVSNKELMVQQAITPIVGFGSYLIGSIMPPEQAKVWRRYITNAAGPYSVYAGLGFAAGQANQQGRRGLPAIYKELEFTVPLPSIEPLIDTARFVTNPSMDTLPRGAVPGFVWEARNFLKQGDTAPASISGMKKELNKGLPKIRLGDFNGQ